ncbi:hypothetical protein CC78DRAFT_602051 [Lojkania enalia]|uniref:Uncharacterized protein n=1 Tax=Lojkania enalia TaxID=147567 RepID=A0A9P4NAS9_9PLEO|nr:hypothetical protein CC78DRAFT_602051 [Didymosphaeria enalia]
MSVAAVDRGVKGPREGSWQRAAVKKLQHEVDEEALLWQRVSATNGLRSLAAQLVGVGESGRTVHYCLSARLLVAVRLELGADTASGRATGKAPQRAQAIGCKDAATGGTKTGGERAPRSDQRSPQRLDALLFLRQRTARRRQAENKHTAAVAEAAAARAVTVTATAAAAASASSSFCYSRGRRVPPAVSRSPKAQGPVARNPFRRTRSGRSLHDTAHQRSKLLLVRTYIRSMLYVDVCRQREAVAGIHGTHGRRAAHLQPYLAMDSHEQPRTAVQQREGAGKKRRRSRRSAAHSHAHYFAPEVGMRMGIRRERECKPTLPRNVLAASNPSGSASAQASSF